MTAAASPTTAPPASAADGHGAIAAPLLLCATGALAALGAGMTPPTGLGAARLADPGVLLAVLDTVWLLLLIWPRGRNPAESLVLLAIGAPFHAALAGAAGAGSGHLGAWALMLGGWTLVASAVPHGRRYAACLGFAAIVVPLTGYGLREFLSVATLDAVLASPLTGPTLLARAAPTVGVGAAVPGLLLALAVLAACRGNPRGAGGRS